MEEKTDVKEFLVLELNLAYPMFVASALSEIWLSLLSLMFLLLSLLAITLDTAVAKTTAKMRNPVTEKTLSCFLMHHRHHHLEIFLENHSCFLFYKIGHLVLVLLALFAPKEAVEREMKKGEIRRRRAIRM